MPRHLRDKLSALADLHRTQMSHRTAKAPGPSRPLESRLLAVLRVGVERHAASTAVTETAEEEKRLCKVIRGYQNHPRSSNIEGLMTIVPPPNALAQFAPAQALTPMRTPRWEAEVQNGNHKGTVCFKTLKDLGLDNGEKGTTVDDRGNTVTVQLVDGCLMYRSVTIDRKDAPFRGTINMDGNSGDERITSYVGKDGSKIQFDEHGNIEKAKLTQQNLNNIGNAIKDDEVSTKTMNYLEKLAKQANMLNQNDMRKLSENLFARVSNVMSDKVDYQVADGLIIIERFVSSDRVGEAYLPKLSENMVRQTVKTGKIATLVSVKIFFHPYDELKTTATAFWRLVDGESNELPDGVSLNEEGMIETQYQYSNIPFYAYSMHGKKRMAHKIADKKWRAVGGSSPPFYGDMIMMPRTLNAHDKKIETWLWGGVFILLMWRFAPYARSAGKIMERHAKDENTATTSWLVIIFTALMVADAGAWFLPNMYLRQMPYQWLKVGL